MAMKSKVMILIALVLAVATAATTMTAFAEPKEKNDQISEQVADSVHATSQAILRLKVQQVRRVQDNYQPPSITLAKPTPN